MNRLGTIESGTTVSDWDEDEHRRQLSISLSLTHTSWQGRKINLLDCPGDPSFQGDVRCALRVVEGALVVVSAVIGLEVGTARVKKLADELGLARVWFVNMLDRERADFFRTLGQIQEQFGSKCVAVHIPIGVRARAARDRRRAPHVRLPLARTAARRPTRWRSRTTCSSSRRATARSSSTRSSRSTRR